MKNEREKRKDMYGLSEPDPMTTTDPFSVPVGAGTSNLELPAATGLSNVAVGKNKE